MPPLDYGPDPQGRAGVFTDQTGRHVTRWLAPADVLGPAEHRHSVHACEGTRAAGRAAMRAAQADWHRSARNKRGRRREPEVTGVVVQPSLLDSNCEGEPP
jgi:hypothetical protein